MSRHFAWLAFWIWLQVGVVHSQVPAQTFFPPSIPLANRSPYMSVWYPSTNGSYPLSSTWPTFWDQQNHVSWLGRIRVDGQTYQWMGGNAGPPFSANITSVQITPTRSIFIVHAGPMNVTLTFLSPIEPSDWVMQSFPFSYLSVDVSSLDGQAHDVQVYSDITAEWLSGNSNSPVTWTENMSGGSIYHELQLQFPQEGVEEVNQQAQDGIAYYAMAQRPGLSWQIGEANAVRNQFDTEGSLTNTVSQSFAPIAPVYTIFGFAVNLGPIQSTPQTITSAVGYVRNPSISYSAPSDSTVYQLSPYFVTKYGNNTQAAIDDFTSGYHDALQRAVAFDAAIIAGASAVSPEYVNLVSLAARQTLSTLDITVSMGSDGKPNTSDVRIFMKDIGSPGTTTARVNPVERIYAAMPALLYVNASLVGPLLAPLLDAQDNLTSESLAYAAGDIGTAYPNATGTHGEHRQGIEQSGNMLIMMYAHARFSGDGSLLQKHYNLAKHWTDYLVNNTLTPLNQLSADNEGTPNMTNLAIKGIIGIKAMAQISHALGEDSDAQQYDSFAAALVEQWQSLAQSSDQLHLLGIYGEQSSWALMYNLYADRLLGTNLVNKTILQNQTVFYRSLLAGTSSKFGLPLDSTAIGTSAAWLLFTAATVQDDDVRNNLVRNAWLRASSNLTAGAFPDQYQVADGTVLGGQAGPAVGGVFSLLALNLPTKDILVPANQSLPGDGPYQTPSASDGGHRGHSSTRTSIIAGASVAVVGVVLIAVSVFFWLRRKRGNNTPGSEVTNEAPGPAVTPYFLPSQETRTGWNDRPGSTGLQGQVPKTSSTEPTGFVNTSLIPLTPPEGVPIDSRSTNMREVSLKARLAYAESQLGAIDARPPASSPVEPLSPFAGTQSTRSGSRRQGSLTLTDVQGLRAEVENLRREMQEQMLAPPPEYTG